MPHAVEYDVAEGIGTITLNHPERRNALSRELLAELGERLTSADTDAQVRVVLIGAAGSVFSSGHDLNELAGTNRQACKALFESCTEVMLSIVQMSKPVIAVVNGLATAAGCQLVASCDLVVASTNARFATPGVKIGLFCSTPAVALARAVPPKKAMEMLLTGVPISAETACEIGLVNRVVAPERLNDEARDLARSIMKTSAYTLAVGKKTFYEQLPCPIDDAYSVAQKTMVDNTLANDGQEGITAFLEKREPEWESDEPKKTSVE